MVENFTQSEKRSSKFANPKRKGNDRRGHRK